MEKFITKNTIDLSIIIVSYNTKDLLLACINSVKQTSEKLKYEVIVVDNASSDGSAKAVKEEFSEKNIIVLENEKNYGFSKANNIGVEKSIGRYVLFLNPDTVVHDKTLSEMIKFMEEHPDAGAATCKVEIPSGSIDEASHRGFPTPWNAFCHFSKLERLFSKSKIFAGYTQGWKDLDTTHTVDAIVGAFMLLPRTVGEKLRWWNEDYFFYGEDLDLCFRIRELGYKIYYVPSISILHYGGVSSGIKKQTKGITTANIETKIMVQNARFDAMRIFYREHYTKKYPFFITLLVLNSIDYLNKKNLKNLQKQIVKK